MTRYADCQEAANIEGIRASREGEGMNRLLYLPLGFVLGLVIAAGDVKPAPVSAPLPTPTEITVEKGTYGAGDNEGLPAVDRARGEAPGGLPGDGSAMVAHRSYKSEVAGSNPAHPTDIPWEGLVVLPDLSVVYLDLEMAATQASISLQESTWRCDAHRTTVVAGITYEVFGLYQLLYDSSIQRLTESMGYTKADLLSCQPNALVAQGWRRLTDKGVEWRLWVARPQYRTDESTSGEW